MKKAKLKVDGQDKSFIHRMIEDGLFKTDDLPADGKPTVVVCCGEHLTPALMRVGTIVLTTLGGAMNLSTNCELMPGVNGEESVHFFRRQIELALRSCGSNRVILAVDAPCCGVIDEGRMNVVDQIDHMIRGGRELWTANKKLEIIYLLLVGFDGEPVSMQVREEKWDEWYSSYEVTDLERDGVAEEPDRPLAVRARHRGAEPITIN